MTTIIPLEHIILGKEIVDFVNKHSVKQIDWSKYKIVESHLLPLSEERYKSIATERNVENIPDIDVRIKFPATEERRAWKPKHIVGSPKKISAQPAYYEILNGRHRVANAIIKGNTHIRAQVLV